MYIAYTRKLKFINFYKLYCTNCWRTILKLIRNPRPATPVLIWPVILFYLSNLSINLRIYCCVTSHFILKKTIIYILNILCYLKDVGRYVKLREPKKWLKILYGALHLQAPAFTANVFTSLNVLHANLLKETFIIYKRKFWFFPNYYDLIF